MCCEAFLNFLFFILFNYSSFFFFRLLNRVYNRNRRVTYVLLELEFVVSNNFLSRCFENLKDDNLMIWPLDSIRSSNPTRSGFSTKRHARPISWRSHCYEEATFSLKFLGFFGECDTFANLLAKQQFGDLWGSTNTLHMLFHLFICQATKNVQNSGLAGWRAWVSCGVMWI